jgi:hypothetical protein
VIGITNRLTNALKQYYPQALDWFEHKDTLIFCDFLNRWPTLRQVKQARQSTLESFFHQHNVRRAYLIERCIQGIRSATSLTDDQAVIRPYQMVVQAMVEQLRALLQAIDHFDTEIDLVAKSLPDYDLFAALPGAGHIMAPRLSVAFGEGRDRYANAAQVQRYSGVAPVVERSGNKCWVHWRIACPTFLRQTYVEWAGSTIPNRSGLALTISNNVTKAVLIVLQCGRWHLSGSESFIVAGNQGHHIYDESIYLKSLRRRGSPLLANLSENAKIT